ncbi:MAG: protein kinase [Bifidobacteriaceae bacterium]|jgi:serine/threonine-protein kinase|nr:protein kinase [Bifidobacteriaceae bacterium]
MIAQTGLLLADGRYRLVSRIAVGGMGEVWRAHDLLADGPVAIKVLRPEFTGDQISLKRLRIEARNASLLNHPNITTVHDYREHEGTGYLVMEYIDGQSLADVLAAHATIAPLRLLPILVQSSLGLHAAHTAGVVHRDVKPGNILLGPSDHVKLTDFGISVAHGQLALTDTGKVMGTAQYLAPEQALGNPATPAGDLYSLGVIAYEALVGRRPFRGANYVAIALAQVNELPPPLPGSVERSLAALVMRLLDKDPAARPAGGDELAGLFGEVLQTHRHLASRLLASRTGTPSGPLLRSADRSGGEAHLDTAEQPAIPSTLVMPPPAPATDVGPVVNRVDQVPAPPTAVAGARLAGAAGTDVAGADLDESGADADGAGQPSGIVQPTDAMWDRDTEPALPVNAPPPTDAPITADGAATGASLPARAAAPIGGESGVEPGLESTPPPDLEDEPHGGAEPHTGGEPHAPRGRPAWPPRGPLIPLPPVAEPGPPPMPVPPAAELAVPIETLPAAEASRGDESPNRRSEGAEVPGLPERSEQPEWPEHPEHPEQSERPGRPGRLRRAVSRDWIWATLVALGLVIIIVIGLLTALNADSHPEGLWRADHSGVLAQASAAVEPESIVSTAPGLGPSKER